MMLCPEISVILSTCNRNDLALDCIDSILRDNFSDFEVLIVDQSPAAELEAQLRARYPGETRLTYLTLDQQALSAARNKGIQHARGRIFVFVDDDAVVEPGWLKAYQDAFTTFQPAPGVVAGRLDPLWETELPTWYPRERMFLLGLYHCGDKLMLMPELDLPVGANFASRREVVEHIGLFDERTGYSYTRRASMIGGEDSLFSLKAKKAGYALCYQPSARVKHRIAANKLTRRYFLKRNFWDGYTLLTVLYLSGSASQEGAPAIIRWHTREIGRQLKLFLQGRYRLTANLSRSQAFMLMLAQCANSLGIIRAAVRLRKNELP